MQWLDLYTEGDAHPRRFSSEETLRRYLVRVARLSDQQAQQLLAEHRLGPPETARGYLIRPLAAPTKA